MTSEQGPPEAPSSYRLGEMLHRGVLLNSLIGVAEAPFYLVGGDPPDPEVTEKRRNRLAALTELATETFVGEKAYFQRINDKDRPIVILGSYSPEVDPIDRPERRGLLTPYVRQVRGNIVEVWPELGAVLVRRLVTGHLVRVEVIRNAGKRLGERRVNVKLRADVTP